MIRSVPVRRRVYGVVAACAAVAGCAGSGGLGARPADIRTDGLAPCSVLTADQQGRLDVRPGIEKAVPDTPGRTAPGCVWLARDLERGVAYSVVFTGRGAETVVGTPDTAVVDVRGYSAVRGTVHALDAVAPTCQVTLDTAPGQAIVVQAQAPMTPAPAPEDVCRAATDAASAILATVGPR